MSIAKRFQTALDSDEKDRISGILCVERRSDPRCLWVFHGEGFEREMDGFDTAALDPTSDHGDQRDFFEFVAPFTLDASGRLIIPAEFRELVGIQDQAYTIGLNSRVEIWSQERWDQRPRGETSPGAGRSLRAAQARGSAEGSA